MARRRLGLEVIDFQHDDTGSRLEDIFQKMYDVITYDPKYMIEDSEHDMRLCRYAKDRFGVELDMHYGTVPDKLFGYCGDFFACTVSLTPYHILDSDFFRGDLRHENDKRVTKLLVDKKGTIDLEKAKVSGMFSNIEISIYLHIPNALKKHKLSVRQLVAIFLHELGHVFTYFEFSDRLTTNNQILVELSKALKTNDKKQMTYVFKELASRNNVDDKVFLDLVDTEDRVVFGYKFFTRYIGTIVSSMVSDKYSRTTAEQLADNFATRFGYGKDIITGLDQVNGYKGFIVGLIYMFEMMDIVMVIKMFVDIFEVVSSKTTKTPGQLFNLLLNLIMTFFILLQEYYRMKHSGDNYRDMTYDDLKDRYKRIRMQYIEILKSDRTPDNLKKKAIDDIKQMDVIIDSTHNYPSLRTIVSNWIFTKNRNTKANIQFEKMLEEMAHNDLFLKSSELSTL